jgi:hypothetical protein
MGPSCSASIRWGAHEHPSLTSPARAQPGNGLLLFIRVDDFDSALPQARTLVARLAGDPHVNPNTGTPEFSLRDPDGYYVTISALSGPEERSGRAFSAEALNVREIEDAAHAPHPKRTR